MENVRVLSQTNKEQKLSGKNTVGKKKKKKKYKEKGGGGGERGGREGRKIEGEGQRVTTFHFGL